MQRRQTVSTFSVLRSTLTVLVVCAMLLGSAEMALAQVNTATLSGTVTDPQGLPVKGARVTVTNVGTSAARSALTDDSGHYSLVGIPPGVYKLEVNGGSGFAPFENPSLELTVGQAATFDPRLSLQGMAQTVLVSNEAPLVEVAKSDVSSTIDSRQITNLPIDGRNYINFTLLNPQSGRDNTPSIGAAPTSGLNF